MTLRGRNGFTLIELSIVLVIIGLVVGGVLVGQDLIQTAIIRAQVSQIEKYKSAVYAFRSKYNCLPGDCASAASFGFIARGSNPGQGDDNGVIEGWDGGAGTGNCGFCAASGEEMVFWVDISAANLIDGHFSIATMGGFPTTVTGSANNGYLPRGKIEGSYVYAWGGGTSGDWLGQGDGANYFGLSAVAELDSWRMYSTPGLSPLQAYLIDQKIDDGAPQSGKVTALYMNYTLENFAPVWAGGSAEGANTAHNPTTAATARAPTTCYDNGGANGKQQQYSLSNTAFNCALSFKF